MIILLQKILILVPCQSICGVQRSKPTEKKNMVGAIKIVFYDSKYFESITNNSKLYELITTIAEECYLHKEISDMFVTQGLCRFG